MNHDIDIKKVRINCFRQSKVAGEFMLQMRVPGAMIEARHLSMVQELCERYGNGTFHMGTRQTLDVPGIKYENIEAVNKFLKGYIMMWMWRCAMWTWRLMITAIPPSEPGT